MTYDPFADDAERTDYGQLHGYEHAARLGLACHCPNHGPYTAGNVVFVECPRCLDDEYDDRPGRGNYRPIHRNY